jgi:uncharacterized protein (TIGR02217 family)
MAVDPVVFPLNNVQKIGGGVQFSTDIQEGTSGVEVRTPLWQDSRHTFDCTPGIRTLDHVRLVRAFFYACNGPEISFLLTDWSDYSVIHTQDVIPNSGGCFEQGVAESYGGSTTVFQLQKLYSNSYRTHARKITRPQSGTVLIYDSNALVTSGYSIDYTTGLVTFTSPPAAAPTWDGNFYVPVRFKDDEVDWELFKLAVSTKKALGEQPELLLIEDRE